MAPDRAKAKDSAASIFNILDSKPVIDSSSEDGTTLSSVTGNISFENVSFKYPTRQDIQIFKDLSLNFPAGKVRRNLYLPQSYCNLFKLYIIYSTKTNIHAVRCSCW